MILGAMGLLVANAATILGAHALLDRVRCGRPSADFVVFLLLRLLLISATVLLAGLCKLLTPLALGGVGLLALGGLVAAGAHRRFPRVGWRWNAWSMLGLLVSLRLLLQVWFLAPYLDDSLAYHLPKIAEWVRAGGFTSELGMDARSTFPAGFELIETWWVVFLHHDVLIELAGVEFLLLTGAAVHAIADGLGWSSRSATVAAALAVLNPALHFQATSCVNDGPVAALVLAAAALLAGGAPWMLVALPVFLGAGVKPTFLYALPGLAVLAALLPRGEEAEPRRSRALIVLCGMALLVGAFWYLRNWAVHGNPIYPMGPGGMKSAVAGSTLQRFGPSLRTLQENLEAFFNIRIYDAQQPYDALCTAGFGWGPAGFALGSLALVVVLREDRLLRRLAAGFAVAAVCVFFLVELDPWNGRFVVYLAALPALALARLWERHRLVAALGALALALQFVETTVPGNLPPGAAARLLGQGWRERASRPAPPTPGRVGLSCDDFGVAYPFYGPDYSKSPVFLRETTADDLIAHLDRESISVVYVTPPLIRRGAAFEEAVRRGRLKPVRHGEWTGYEVVPRP